MSKVINYNDGAKAIANLLTLSECRKFIFDSNRRAFEEATVNSGNSESIIKDIRNNHRIHFYDSSLAKMLYRRVYQFLPKSIDGWRPDSLNERFRFYRYEEGQYFKWHEDDTYVKAPGLESRYTFLMYLNDEFEGGETEFEQFKVAPKTGTAALFPHTLKHQACSIHSGVKYAIRTDVMYRQY